MLGWRQARMETILGHRASGHSASGPQVAPWREAGTDQEPLDDQCSPRRAALHTVLKESHEPRAAFAKTRSGQRTT